MEMCNLSGTLNNNQRNTNITYIEEGKGSNLNES